MENVKEGALRVWHIPQIPMNEFLVLVGSVDEAVLVLDVLADYDNFQLTHDVKPDFCNAQGLEVWEGGEWSEYHNELGEDIDEIRMNLEV